MAGFDRQLVVSYGFEASNPNLLIPQNSGYSVLGFWQQNFLVDGAFGGKGKNVGFTLAYYGGREWNSLHHRAYLAHSYRFNISEHKILVGLGGGLRWWSYDAGYNVYGDQVDPRYGVIFNTNELIASQNRMVATLSTGLIYTFRRLLFSYAFEVNDRQNAPAFGTGNSIYFHSFFATYHLQIRPVFTLSPALGVEYGRSNSPSGVFVFPGLSLMYKDRLLVGISAPYLDRLQLDLGLQFFDGLRVSFRVAPYFLKKAHDANGLATLGGSVRYLIPIWKP